MGSVQNHDSNHAIGEDNSQNISSVSLGDVTSPSTVPRMRLGSFVLLTLVLILIIAGVGYAASVHFTSLRKKPSRVKPVDNVFSVQVFRTESATVQELVQGFGTVRAMKKVTLSAQVAGGIIETIEPLKVGQAISAATHLIGNDGMSRITGGELIVRIDPQIYQEKVDQHADRLREDQAELNRIAQEEKNLNRRLLIQKKSLESFQKEYNRVSNLVKQGIGSPSDLTTAELDLSRYEDAMVQVETELALIPERNNQILARMKTHQNDLDIANIELNRTSVISPISGHFSEVHVNRGQYVRVGDPLVTIINFDRVEIPIGIPLQDYLKIIPQIREQKYPRATIRTNSNSTGTWEGIITRAAPVANPQTRTVEVFVVVDNKNTESPLLPGTFVSISIAGPVYENVIPIPREAVFLDEVFIVRDNKAFKQSVVSKTKIQSFSLIQSGLEPGDQVILTNLDILKSGASVKVSDQEILTLDAELKRLPFSFLKKMD